MRTKSISVEGMKRICLFIFLLCAFILNGASGKEVPQKIVVIDAGHGGKDPGSVVGKAKEKNIVLDIALKLGRLIKENQNNIKVVYIRDGDYFVPLLDRAQIANKANADLFISIHANYCPNPTIYGTETYVLGLHRTEDNLNVAKKENSVILLEDDYTTRYEGFNPNLSESYIMFELIQDSYLDQSLRFASILQTNFKLLAQRHDREVRQAGFLVLRETSMPSVLIETGYLSNKKENSYLMTEEGRKEISRSIYGSLVNYLYMLGSKSNPPATTDQVTATETVRPQEPASPIADVKPQSEFDTAKSEGRLNFPKSPVNDKQTGYTDLPADNQPAAGKNDENKVMYAIQIGVFSKKVDPGSSIFKGISPVREIYYDGKYKYVCCETESFQSTKARYSEVSRSFPDAFIVSIKNNQTKMVWNKRSIK
ncbi:MAG TPA: N-acetylmuramoyl-L-alanine amidase [Prolixibacteraceae bacterium]|nr:N-acetylmuramoyl-L-alanine amidase [Prolixibacteraceae bacterium]